MNKINTLLISSIFFNLSACGGHRVSSFDPPITTESASSSASEPKLEWGVRNADLKKPGGILTMIHPILYLEKQPLIQHQFPALTAKTV